MKPVKIWSGWAEDVPEYLRSPRIPSEGYITLFDTGDIVAMQSEKKLAREAQKLLDEMVMRILCRCLANLNQRKDSEESEKTDNE